MNERSISSKQLTRYDTDRDGDEYATDTGPYVHYTDAQAEIERLSRQVGLLQKSRDEYYEAYWKLKNSGHETTVDAAIAEDVHMFGIGFTMHTANGRKRLDPKLVTLMPGAAVPLCDCDDDFGCKEYDPAEFRCQNDEAERCKAEKAEPLQGPYCPDTNQPCDRMCQSICNRRECAHEFLPTAGQALSETDPRCIKCHRRWSSVNGTVKP